MQIVKEIDCLVYICLFSLLQEFLPHEHGCRTSHQNAEKMGKKKKKKKATATKPRHLPVSDQQSLQAHDKAE